MPLSPTPKCSFSGRCIIPPSELPISKEYKESAILCGGGAERSPSRLFHLVSHLQLLQNAVIEQNDTYCITSQWLFCWMTLSRPWHSTLVPDLESGLVKSRYISCSECVRAKWEVGRMTAIEPPWLTRFELPLHMVEVIWCIRVSHWWTRCYVDSTLRSMRGQCYTRRESVRMSRGWN